jgi:hypothetical protein
LRGEKEMQQVVVFGTQVPVGNPAVPLGLNDPIPEESCIAALAEAGYVSVVVAEGVYKALRDNGYDIPSAWLDVVRAELIGSGIGPGRVNALTAAMQTLCIGLCGTAFVRVLGGSEKTDAETAQQLLRAKHAPQAPVVKGESGWSPTGQAWKEYMRKLAGWLGQVSEPLAASVREISLDFEADHTTQAVVRGSVIDLALGTVLGGESGVGEMHRLAPVNALASGSGLWLLQVISAVIMAPLDEIDFAAWQHPKPLLHA